VSHHNSNPIEWIVCERSSRWASALRMALGGERRFQIRELRHTAELDGELAERPDAIVALEVRRDNFAELVAWLVAAHKRHLHSRSVALVDHSIDSHLDEVRDALVEAGVAAVATSPRQLANVIALAARHAEIAGKAGPNASPLVTAWASLPWQST
jgi:hypothetical protein